MEKMKTTTFTIVGLRHHDWQDSLHEHMSQAKGKRVLLMREDSNDWNREATAAYIDTLMVGYVSNSQCREAAAYCDLSEQLLLEGSVVAVDEESRQLTVTVAVGDEEPQLADENTLYEQWEKQYNTVPMMALTADERRLQLLRRDLLFMLEKHRPYDEMMRHNLTVYEQLMAIDVSREATDDRSCIIRLMQDSTDGDIRQWGRRLTVAVTTLGSPEARQRLAHYLFSQLTATSEFRQMAQRHQQVYVEEMERQLRLFPHRLYDEYLLSHEEFASKLYYRRIPQRPLRFFLSGEGIIVSEHTELLRRFLPLTAYSLSFLFWNDVASSHADTPHQQPFIYLLLKDAHGSFDNKLCRGRREVQFEMAVCVLGMRSPIRVCGDCALIDFSVFIPV